MAIFVKSFLGQSIVDINLEIHVLEFFSYFLSLRILKVLDGHFGCFSILTVANNASTNIGVLIYFLKLLFWVSFPEVELGVIMQFNFLIF